MPSTFASDEPATGDDLEFDPPSSTDSSYEPEDELASDVSIDDDLDDDLDEGEPNDPVVYPVEFEDGRIDPDAAKVVRRLTRHGYEAYLVGGCVRDLLVGRSPKDYDVATSARPDDVRRLFRNSRIIGRRFRLVHVLFGGGKVIETATFRRAPEAAETERGSADLLIKNDNVFGDAHEDATRRDFTINGLFYDIERRVVLDWVGGMPDIERRTVHTIGDPIVRFQEDPVRILRAIKFSARTDFGISPEVYDAMVLCRDALRRAAKPRLFEEVLRLLREGASHRSIWLAWETGILDILLPELSAYLADRPEDDSSVWRLLSEVDARTRSTQGAPDDIVLVAVLLLEPMLEACSGQRDRVDAAWEFMESIVDRLNVPRRIAEPIRRIGAVLPRLQTGRVGRFARTNLYPLASEVAELYAAAHGDAFAAEEDGSHVATPAVSSAPSRRRRRRRR
ncbi:MAG TPA: polynucleotide adenylyltransferase PcnB [Polyangiaceae bacterium]|nr:polynucleotide adenylyltransferase PcnB [Polyangiaceae bacterium]